MAEPDKPARKQPMRWSLAIAALLSIGVATVAALNASHFCFKQWRWLSDEEYIENAMSTVLAAWKVVDPEYHQKLLAIMTMEDCCSLSRKYGEPVIVIVNVSSYVRTIHHRDDPAPLPAVEDADYTFDACGCINGVRGERRKIAHQAKEVCR